MRRALCHADCTAQRRLLFSPLPYFTPHPRTCMVVPEGRR